MPIAPVKAQRFEFVGVVCPHFQWKDQARGAPVRVVVPEKLRGAGTVVTSVVLTVHVPDKVASSNASVGRMTRDDQWSLHSAVVFHQYACDAHLCRNEGGVGIVKKTQRSCAHKARGISQMSPQNLWRYR